MAGRRLKDLMANVFVQLWGGVGGGGTIIGVATSNPVLALTFDDGPDAEWTPRFLDILDQWGAKATFFMIGSRVARDRQIWAETVRRGHAVGNHTWNHASLPLVSRRERIAEVRRCAGALGDDNPRIFRPPHGDMNLSSRIDLAAMGFAVVAWSVVVPDWLDKKAEDLADGIEARLRPGAIVLLHDSLYDASDVAYYDRSQSLRAVDNILRRCSGRYEFVTVPQLLTHGTPEKVFWWKRSEPKFLNGLQCREGKTRQYPMSA